MEGHLMRKTIMLSAALAVFLGLAACGEKEPSKLTYGEAALELAKGADSFKTYIGGLDNKLVKWAGTVVETRKWHEDDFVPAAGMLVDADGKPGPDLFVTISVDDLEKVKTGAKVDFTAKLLGAADEKGVSVIKLEADTIH
ncbi:MAG: hypothetical protein CMM61_09360 [Rhodospirillaceae bacterium]|nr:hypothetical protein [Rhodospirillaceae bacterium]